MGFTLSAGIGGTAGRANGCKDQSLGRLSMDGTKGIFGFVALESPMDLTADLPATLAAAVFLLALLTDFFTGPAAVATKVPTASDITRAV
ncbi:MAG TPA: hypothetical protein VEQ63_11815 [Bryobacteraceae bacterium]|nr:hypothetical protein [Bryobacteraceae bacterium]